MAFADRAVKACEIAMTKGTVTERHVRDVLKCEEVNVKSLEVFLESKNSTVRRMTAAIIGGKGESVESLLDAIVVEDDKVTLLAMLSEMAKRKDGVESLRHFISDDDSVIREAAVDMFRRAGRPNSLFPLLFDEDDAVVQRVKRYLNE